MLLSAETLTCPHEQSDAARPVVGTLQDSVPTRTGRRFLRQAPGYPVNSWFGKNLGDAMMAFDSLDKIHALFQSTYGTDGCPKDVGVFIRHNSEGSLHCQVEVYFSPASASLAQAMCAQPCGKPSISDLDLLAGSKDSWSILFSERFG